MLIDTCVVYRWLIGTFSNAELFQDGATVSAVSIWEMLIKHNKGSLPLPTLELASTLTDNGFTFLNVTPAHAQAIANLPNHHKDPFDRMIIAQAMCEDMRVVTYDRVFADYLPKTMLV